MKETPNLGQYVKAPDGRIGLMIDDGCTRGRCQVWFGEIGVKPCLHYETKQLVDMQNASPEETAIASKMFGWAKDPSGMAFPKLFV